MKTHIFLSLFLLSALFATAQTKGSAQVDGYYPLLRQSFDGNNAHQTVAFVEQRWRVAGNTGFNESIYQVEEILKKAGYVKEEKSESDGPLTYRIEKRKMKRPAWDPISASVTIMGEPEPVLQFTSNRNMLAINSASTPAEGVTAEVVDVGKGAKNDVEGKVLKGKILFGEGSLRALYMLALRTGAAGVMTYSMPAYTQPEKNVNSIQFQSIPYQDTVAQKWGIVLSYAAKTKLKAALAGGSLSVNVKVVSKIYESEELTIVANARGVVKPDERFVFSAHVQEPGANDNASGVGTLAEMARVTAELVKQKKYTSARTITFLWGDEIVSTARYIKDDAERAKGIKWGLSLDMVGEDVAKTGGSFLIEKMPDPSAIWTRGKEKHTEWGGSVLKESDMFPHYFNDLLLNRCRQQAQENGWVVNTNPFEGGSDHTPFLEAKIPGLLMWHFTDVFYHTDADRLDKVSAAEMRNVGISALATAFTLASADEDTALALVEEIKTSAVDRLNTEYQLSAEAVAKGAAVSDEQHILEVWTKWYKAAIDKMNDIPVKGMSAKVGKALEAAKAAIEKSYQGHVAALTAKK